MVPRTREGVWCGVVVMAGSVSGEVLVRLSQERVADITQMGGWYGQLQRAQQHGSSSWQCVPRVMLVAAGVPF